MRIALAQLNAVVGDLRGNGEQILAACRQAAAQGADLVVTPELALWGYPPRDLLLPPQLLARQLLQGQTEQLAWLAAELGGLKGSGGQPLALLLGLVEPIDDGSEPGLFNAAALLRDGHWRMVARKQRLPGYDVFDEPRYFRPGDGAALLELPVGGRPWRLGLTICEDLWVEPQLLSQRLAGPDPVGQLQALQPDLLLNLSASPFELGKPALRRQLAARAAGRLGCPVLYVNAVGGNDELVFDGSSFVLDAGGAPLLQLPFGREALTLWEVPAAHAAAAAHGAALAGPRGTTTAPPPGHPAQTPTQPWEPTEMEPSESEQLLRALVLGVRDYARKCGFRQAVLGLSGGIDSSLVAVVAAAALGSRNVLGLLLPSPYSSEGSILDARALAKRLDLASHTLPIAALMAAFDAALEPALQAPPSGLAAENLQSRIRGSLLMALSNQQGRLLLATGNKSELAVGYCTLYGDMNGALAVIGDVYKSQVFALCAWLDSPAASACRAELGLPAQGALVGEAIRAKPPSAELRPNQRDSDSLPDYAVLDPLLQALIDPQPPGPGPQQPPDRPMDPALVARVQGLLRRAEFKRRQAPPVLKVSRRAFGSGWRMPIAAG